jgi:hypothetical protein
MMSDINPAISHDSQYFRVRRKTLEGVQACGFNPDLRRKQFPEQGLSNGAATVVSLAENQDGLKRRCLFQVGQLADVDPKGYVISGIRESSDNTW